MRGTAGSTCGLSRYLLEAAERAASGGRAWDEAARSTEHAARLYRGPFLEGEHDPAWAAALAEHLPPRLVRRLVIGRHWDSAGQWDKAADCHEEALRVDPCAEDVARLLMTIDRRRGHPAQVQGAPLRSLRG